jgi:hypothetical protein
MHLRVETRTGLNQSTNTSVRGRRNVSYSSFSHGLGRNLSLDPQVTMGRQAISKKRFVMFLDSGCGYA